MAGRVAVITGAARGQGRTHAVALAEHGCNVVIVDRPGTLESALETLSLVELAGAEGLVIEADVTDWSAMNTTAAQVLERFGRIDVLLANAGIMTQGSVVELTDEAWRQTIDVNRTGVFHSIRSVLPAMIERGFGRIVATSSMAGRRGFAGIAHYSASKWGVIGLIKSAALEVAGNGITVNAICPATVETEMLAGIKRSDPCTPASNPIPVRSMTSDVVTRTMLHIVTDPGFITGCTFELGLGTSAMMP